MKMCDFELSLLLHRMDVMDFVSLYHIANAAWSCRCSSCQTTWDHAQLLMQWHSIQCNAIEANLLGCHFTWDKAIWEKS